VIQIPVLSDNYQYLVACETTRQAAVIDAPDAPAAVSRAKKEGLTLAAIWNTHHHWDHVGGNDELFARFKLPVSCSTYDLVNGRVPHAAHALREGDTVSLGEVSFAVLDVPGHTLGHIAFYGHGALICGDTLFGGGCGRLFEGTPEMMWNSLAKLKALPDETLVYCMHEYTLKNLEFASTLEPDNPALRQRIEDVRHKRVKNLPTVPSTIGMEKATNPFLRWDSAAIRENLRRRGCSDLNGPVGVFAAMRRLKDEF
jgi:hydroxyacylglutathione hydrolase